MKSYLILITLFMICVNTCFAQDVVVDYENGNVMDISNYKKGLKDGNCLFYNKQGDLLLTREYAEGKLISEKRIISNTHIKP